MINTKQVENLYNSLPKDVKLELGSLEDVTNNFNDEKSTISMLNHLNEKGIPYGSLSDYKKEDPKTGKTKAKASSGSASASAQLSSSSGSLNADNPAYKRTTTGSKKLEVSRPSVSTYRDKLRSAGKLPLQEKSDNIITKQKTNAQIADRNFNQKKTKKRVVEAKQIGLEKAIRQNGGSMTDVVLEEDPNKRGVVEATDVDELLSGVIDPLSLTDNLIQQGNFKLPNKDVLLSLKKLTGKEEFEKEEISNMNYEMNKQRVVDYVKSKKDEDPDFKVETPKLTDDKVDTDNLQIPKEFALMKLYDETGNENPTDEEVELKVAEMEADALDKYIYEKEGFFAKSSEVSAKLLQESIHNPEKAEFDQTGLLGEVKPVNVPMLDGNLYKYGFNNENPNLINIDEIKSIDKTDFAKFLLDSGLEQKYENDMSQIKNQDDQFNILQKYITWKAAKSNNDYRLNAVKEQRAINKGDEEEAIVYNKAKLKALDEVKYNAVNLSMDVMAELPSFKKQYDEELALHNSRKKAKHNISEGDYSFTDLMIAGTGLLGDSAGKIGKLTSGTAAGLFEISGYLGGELLDFLGETVGVKNDGDVFRKFMKGAADHTDNYYTKQLFNTDRFATGVFSDVERIHYKGKTYTIDENGLMYDDKMNQIVDTTEILDKGEKAGTDTEFSLHSAVSEAVSQLVLMGGAGYMSKVSMSAGAGLIGQDLTYVLSSLKDNLSTIEEAYPSLNEHQKMAYALPLSMIDSAFERIMPDYKFLDFSPVRSIISTIKNEGKHLTANGVWEAGMGMLSMQLKEQVEEHGVAVASDLWNRLTNMVFDADKLKTGISANEVLTTTAITALATAGIGSKNTIKTFNASRIDLQNALVFAARDEQTNKELKVLLNDPKFEQLTSSEYVSTLKAAVHEMEKQTARLPKKLSIEATVNTLPIIEQRNKLEQEKKENDPAFNAPIDAEIKELNKTLGELYAADLSNTQNEINQKNRQGSRGQTTEGSTTKRDGDNQTIEAKETSSKEVISKVVEEVSNKMMETGLAEGFQMQTQEEFDQKLNELGKNDKGADIKAFVHDGQIYFNQDKVTPETAVHEFGHLWTDFTKANDSEVYQRGTTLIQSEGQVYMDEAKKDNPELEGDALIEEALVRAIADQGGKIIDEQKKATFTEWLNNLWDSIAFELGIKDKSPLELQAMSLQEFASAVSTDLLKGDKITDEAVKSKEVKFSKSANTIDYSNMVRQNKRFDPKKVDQSVVDEIIKQAEDYNKNNSKTEAQIEKRIDEALAKHNKNRRNIELNNNRKKLRSENKKNKKLLDLLKIDTKYLSHKSALEFESYVNDLAKMSKDKLNREGTLNDEIIEKFKKRESTGRVNQHIDNAIKEGGNRISEAHQAAVDMVNEYMDHLNTDGRRLKGREVSKIAKMIVKFNKNNDKTTFELREKLQDLTRNAINRENTTEIVKYRKKIRSQLKSPTALKHEQLDLLKDVLRIDISGFNSSDLHEYRNLLEEVYNHNSNYTSDGSIYDNNMTLDLNSNYKDSGMSAFEFALDLEKNANRRRFKSKMKKATLADLKFTKEEIDLMNTPNSELSVDEQLEKKVLKELEVERRDEFHAKIDSISNSEIDTLLEEKEVKLTQEQYEKRKALAEKYRKSIIEYAKSVIPLIESSGDAEIQFIKDLNFDNMMTNDLLLVNKLVNNYITNMDRTAIQRFKEIAKAEKAVAEIKQMNDFSGDHGLPTKTKTWIRDFYRTSLTLNNFLLNMTGTHKMAAKLYNELGFADLSAASTRVKKRDALFNKAYADAMKEAKKLNNRNVDLTSRTENIRRAIIGTLLQAEYNPITATSIRAQLKQEKNNEFAFRRQIEKYVDQTIQSYVDGGDVGQGTNSNLAIAQQLKDFKQELEDNNIKAKDDFVKYIEQSDAGNWKLVSTAIDQFLDISEDFGRVAAEVHNLRPKIYTKSDMYLPLRKRNVNNKYFGKTNKERLTEKGAQLSSVNSSSSHNIDRQANARLHTGEVIDLDFDTGIVEAFNSQVYDIESSAVITRMSYILSNPDLKKKLGSHAGALQDRAAFKILSDRGDLITKEDFVSNVLKPIERRLRTLGAVAALGGITQPLKQGLPVIFSAYVRQALLDTKATNPLTLASSLFNNGVSLANYSIRFMGNNANDIPLLQQSSIYYRDDQNVHYGWSSDRKSGGSISGVNKSKTRRLVERTVGETDSLVDTVQKIVMTPLRKGDSWAANSTFMMYYEARLREQGLKIDDWKTEHLKLNDTADGKKRKEALDYAQHLINSTQLSSDFTESNMLFNNQSLAAKVVGNVFFSFQRMANNSKSRLGVSALNVLHGEDIKHNGIEVMSTVAEMAVFQATKQFLLAPLWIAGMALIKGAFFDDDEETKSIFDQYIDELVAYTHQQKFASSMLADISPAPEGPTMKFGNYIMYALDRAQQKLPPEMTYEAYLKSIKDHNKKNPNDPKFFFYNYEKPNEEWYDYIGLYGIPISNAIEAKDATKPFLFEQVSEDSSFGGVTQYDYSKVDKTVLGLHALTNVLAAGSLMDVDILRQERKLFREEIKAKAKGKTSTLSTSKEKKSSDGIGSSIGKSIGKPIGKSIGSSSRSSSRRSSRRSSGRSSRRSSGRSSRRS